MQKEKGGSIMPNSGFLHAGFDNYISSNKIVAVSTPGSAPIKRTIAEAKETGVLIDLTSGRKTKAVVFTSDGRMFLVAINTSTLIARHGSVINDKEDNGNAEGQV